jgi:3-hydroxyacyl-CoA dehydrogenase
MHRYLRRSDGYRDQEREKPQETIPQSSMYEEYKEPLFAAPPLLSRMVDAGLLGRKSGRGFYDYTATT